MRVVEIDKIKEYFITICLFHEEVFLPTKLWPTRRISEVSLIHFSRVIYMREREIICVLLVFSKK